MHVPQVVSKFCGLGKTKGKQLSINFQVCSLLSYITVIFLLMVLVAGDKQLPVPRGKRCAQSIKYSTGCDRKVLRIVSPLVSHEPREASNFIPEQLE